MTRLPPFSALLLAGGRSRRMGRDKALLPHPETGVALLTRQAAVLRAAGCSEVLLAAPAERAYALPGARRIDDAALDRGPLGGLVAGLAAAESPLVLVLAVDLPRVDAELLRSLVANATTDRGVVPLDAEGRPEPLCAVYPKSRHAYFASALAEERLALRPLLAAALAAGWMTPAPAAPAALLNWNRPEDLIAPDA